MNDGRLGRALLDLTEPPPGLGNRVLADLPATEARIRRRVAWPQWAAGAAALLLAVAIVAALLVARQPVSSRQSMPAAPPAVLPPMSAAGIAAASFTSPSAGWVVQAAGISSTADAGSHWSNHAGVALGDGVIGIWPGPGEMVLAVTQERGPGRPATPMPIFWRSTDGGTNWRRFVAPGDSSTYWGPLSVKDGNEAWLVTQTPATDVDPVATVLHTTDGGQSWHAQATFHVKSVFGPSIGDFQGRLAFLDNRHAVLTTDFGRAPELPTEPPYVFTTSDGGAHWSKVHLPHPPPDIDSTNQDAALAVPVAGGQLALVLDGMGARREYLIGPESTPAYVYSSADGGQHWSGPHELPGPHALTRITSLTVVDDAHWWWGSQTGVSFSSDQGRHWRALGGLPRPARLVDIQFSSASDGWVLAENAAGSVANTLFTTSDGGRTWTAVIPPDPIPGRQTRSVSWGS